MNMLEDTLAAALTETAAEIAPDHLPPLRLPARPARRPGRAGRPPRSWAWFAVPVTAAAAVAGVTALSVALTAQGGPGQPPPGTLASGGPALPPRYAALAEKVQDGGTGIDSSLVIRDTATGRTLATVEPPGGANAFCDLSGTPDGRTFVAEACTGWVADNGGDQTVRFRQPKLYRLTVDDQGKVTALSPLAILPPSPNDLDALAVSPDGSKLAVASADHRGDFGRDPVIGLYSLDTGQLLRSWAWDGQADIMGRAGGLGSMSFSADGTTLEFPLSVGEQLTGQVRLLDTTAPGSSLRQARLVMDFGRTPNLQVASPLQGADSMITPDGSRIVASTADVSGQPASTQLTVSEFSATTGARAAVLDPVSVSGNAVLYRAVLWSSPDGSTLIAAGVPDAPGRAQPIGVVTASGFTPLPGSMDALTRIAF
jgi:WD40 repeat protein